MNNKTSYVFWAMRNPKEIAEKYAKLEEENYALRKDLINMRETIIEAYRSLRDSSAAYDNGYMKLKKVLDNKIKAEND